MENENSEHYISWKHVHRQKKAFKEQLRRMADLYQNKLLCDVELIAGNDRKSIQAHRLILASCSEVLCKHFQNTSPTDQVKIDLENVDWYILEDVIEFCYTGKISISLDDVEKVLTLAIELQMDDLVDACYSDIDNLIDSWNCFKIAQLAKKTGDLYLSKTIQEYVLKNFMEVSQRKAFLQIDYEELLTYLKSDEIRVDTEEHVFNAVLKWIAYKPKKRNKFFSDLLRLVRIELLEPRTLLRLCPNGKGVLMVLNAYKSRMLVSPIDSRNCINQLLVIARSHEKTFIAKAHGIQEEYEWKELRCEVRPCIVTVTNNMLIGIGQMNPFQLLEMFSYDLNNGETKIFPAMMEFRRWFSFVVFENSIFVFGGDRNSKCLDTVERIDMSHYAVQRWYYVAPMTAKRKYSAAAVLNGLIYVVGGENDTNGLQSVESYCPRRNIWSMVAPMGCPRHHPMVAVGNGYLYACDMNPLGGECKIDQYNPQTNSWSMLCIKRGVSTYLKCCMLGNRLLVYQLDGKMVEEYNISTRKWIPKPRLGFNLHLISHYLILIV